MLRKKMLNEGRKGSTCVIKVYPWWHKICWTKVTWYLPNVGKVENSIKEFEDECSLISRQYLLPCSLRGDASPSSLNTPPPTFSHAHNFNSSITLQFNLYHSKFLQCLL